MRSFCSILFLLILFLSAPLFAYTTHRTTVGPLTMYFGTSERLAKQETITEINKPLMLRVVFKHTSKTPLSLKLTYSTIETLEFSDAIPMDDKRTFTYTMHLPVGAETHNFPKVIAKPGILNAHYPVRLDVEFEYEGKTHSAQIIQVIKTDIPKVAYSGQFNMTLRGGLALVNFNTYRGLWNYDGKPEQTLPVGFQGSEEKSAASISRTTMTRGGVSRQSFSMHPPWRGGVGNVSAEFLIKLPDAKPISLSFFSAMRDVNVSSNPPETPSDGVTYRVKVDGNTVYEKHDAGTDWSPHEVDLSQFAGKEIRLALESDPGPKRNTNCDSCFWGDVVLFAGEKPKVLSAEEKQKLFAENLLAVKTGKTDSTNTQVFKLDGGLTGAVTFGENGFIDGIIGLGNAEKQVQFDGLRVWVKGQQAIGAAASALSCGKWEKVSTSKYINYWSQRIDIEGRNFTLLFGIQNGIHGDGPALQFMIGGATDEWIDRIEFGPATHHASRVYYGHGYCIEEPEAFTANANGHDLSTSHVGMDFDNGLSVLQATDFPPDRFVVDPKSKRYTISVHPGTTITLLPGLSGALDCAVRYRPLHVGKPSPGFKTKAGRFVFDIWGGKFTEHTEVVKLAAKYGLTDAQFIVHNWQRYGYDVRLPDIFPPNPDRGTLAEMQETLKLCDSLGIQYGVHDNYIDFYPDADEYGFDVTTFTEDGQPKPAWNNYGVEAQSYQFRPDHVQRFLERNLDLIVPELPMSTYFVDVFTSLPPIDFYDRDGEFNSRADTQFHWGEAFDTIRDRLSEANKNFESATTSSEAGMDSLIGHLDGADCQFMFLSSEPGEFRNVIRCKDWSRVPWFDAVHHTKFSLHGVGYSNRYEAQRGRELHGIESDDYIVSEILTGHALMVDWQSARRGAVRKYWLAQDLIRHLADKNIETVEFVDDNIYRLKITWSDGTTVQVNTGTEDWETKPHCLPPYGFYAIVPNSDVAIKKPFKLNAGIIKVNGNVMESSYKYLPNDKKVQYANVRIQEDKGLIARGGSKIEVDQPNKTAIITLLPDEPVGGMMMTSFGNKTIKSVAAIDEKGKVQREVPFEQKEQDRFTFTTQPGEFAYKIVW